MAGEILHNLQKTLDTTLESFLDLVGCDGGSVYTVRKNSDGEEILKFEAMITRSINLRGVPEHLRSLEFQINDSSAVGRTAAHRKPLLLNMISGEVSPRVGDMLNYPTRNIFSGPLITPRGDLVGVVQLLSKLPQGETPFDPYDTSPLSNSDTKDERLLSVIARQAAVAIDDTFVIDEEKRLIKAI